MDSCTRRLTWYILTLILVGVIFPMGNNVAFDAINRAQDLVSMADERNTMFLTELLATGRYDYYAKAFAELYQMDDAYEELVRIRDIRDE